MARYQEARPVLEAAADWRDRCLIHDGSVFSDRSLWSRACIQELDRYYARNLDYGEGDFFSKLEAQLAPASEEAKQLAAEMLWVMYLIVSSAAMGAETKRYQIRKVWSWSGEELPEDHPLLHDVLDRKISRPGTAYQTHRWREFLFFITIVKEWKDLDGTSRDRLLADPWRFATWLEDREHAQGRQLRHILLYLLFPDQFERILTTSHKKKIIKVFRTRWEEEPEAVDYSNNVALDRELLKVRERLATEQGREPDEIDFYQQEIAAEWRPEKSDPGHGVTTDWEDPEDARKWLQDSFGDCRIWLLSVPGGGRLWREFRDGGFIAMGRDYLGDLTEYPTRTAVQEAIAKKEGRPNPRNHSLASWQFAHEMEIGDIVIGKKGVRQLLGWGRITGEYTYEPDRGEYQHVRSVDWQRTGHWTLQGDQRGVATKTLTEFRQYPRWSCWALKLMGGADVEAGVDDQEDTRDFPITKALQDLFLDPEQFTQILNTLSRRRNVVLQGPPGVGKTFMARRIAYALIGRRDLDRVQLVQFHQSYAYEDFIQGWRPNEQGGFVRRDGIFHRFCKRAAADPSGEPFVFIIDEINRGNLSRILGELMMLIESDKRGPDHAIPLTYSPDETFFVPENVYLLGLMNTADRSLAMVDYALRRRFGFIDVEPAFGKDPFNQYLLQQDVPEDLVRKINQRMEHLNKMIRKDRQNLGPGFEIGHSYFVPTGDEEELDDPWYEGVVESEVAPLLREYWFDQPERVDEHVGDLLA